MALRTENGWWAVEPDACEWRRIPGAEHVSIQVQKGWPAMILCAYIADYHAYIEPVRDHDTACYTRENSVYTSNHKSATAADINWGLHPFRVNYAGFDDAKIKRMRELLAFYNFKGVQVVFWAQDWQSPKDAMHHQLGYNTWNNPVVAEFIKERIRPDGFSTYKRGGAPAPPPKPVSKADQYAVAIIAEGRRRGISPRGIQIALSTALVESNLKMYANSTVSESLKIPHDAVGSDHDSVGLFQQRHPMWGPLHILMDPTASAGLFYDRLARMDYNNPSRSAGSFAADIQRPAAQYRGRYDERMGDAVALYNRLAGTTPPAQGEDELSAEAERKIDVIYRELTQRHPSRSPFRHVGEGAIDTWAGIDINADAHGHVARVIAQAKLGHPESIALLREVAGADPQKYPDRRDDALLAQAVLAGLNEPETSSPEKAFAPQVVDNTRELVEAYVEIDRLREENTRLREAADTRTAMEVYEPDPTITSGSKTSGQLVGGVVDSMEEFIEAALQMNPKQRDSLARALNAIELSQTNGSKK